jgi:beta-glucosidase
MRFPDGFTWGAATSAYQIEGSIDADGRGRSIWDTFSHTPGAIADGTTGDTACDHYHRYREDVALMAELGLPAYRFSIAWPRVLPDGSGPVNQAGVDFYSRLVDDLLEHGITPLLTLYHWDLPQRLQDHGGWSERGTASRFADYAAVVAKQLGDRVHTFTTLNEPWCSAFLGYASGEHAPGLRDLPAAFAAAHHLLLAHGLGAAAVRAERPGAEISVTLNPAKIQPASTGERDVRAARRAELTTNQLFLDPLLRAEIRPELIAATGAITDWSFVQASDLRTIGIPIDFLGVNYYGPQVVGDDPGPDAPHVRWQSYPDAYLHTPPPPHTGMGWRVEPSSFTDLLVGLAAEYPNTPMVVTENGAAYPDEISPDGAVHDAERTAYFRAHIAAVADAIGAGVDVRGYFAWSLLDNFEWAWGLAQRFGIVHVDFETQQRTPKDSARLLSRVVAGHGDVPELSSAIV